MIFYISDLHLGHENIIKLCNRPFNTIEEHDNFIINLWNDTVCKDDDVYILGDIAYRNKTSIEAYLGKLKGRKHLIIGNHDLKYVKKSDSIKMFFTTIDQITMVKDGENHVVLCHYPIADWSGYNRGWYHVHGHIHNRCDNAVFKYLKGQERALNAGVDINNFKPVTFNELVINNERFKSEH